VQWFRQVAKQAALARGKIGCHGQAGRRVEFANPGACGFIEAQDRFVIDLSRGGVPCAVGRQAFEPRAEFTRAAGIERVEPHPRGLVAMDLVDIARRNPHAQGRRLP